MSKVLSFFLWSLFVIAVIGKPIEGTAQERQMGGVGVTVFTERNFRGQSSTFRRDVSDLEPLGLNDKISSIRVGRGERWEVCEHADFQGRCVVVSGSESDLRTNDWNDLISSLRRVGGGVPPRPPAQGGPYIVLFDQTNYRGNPTNYNEANPSLPNVAQSVTIGRGAWLLCEGRNYSGRCVTLDRSVPDLETYNLRNRVFSMRPVGPGESQPPPTSSDRYIVLFDRTNYRGNPTNYNGPSPNLSGRAQSVTIGRGVWELCDGRNYRGRCVTLDQSVPDLRTYNLRNQVYSVRPVEPGASQPPPTSGWYIVLFDRTNYRGNPTNYNREMSDLGSDSRRAQSVTIGRGVWELCEGRNFTGTCITLDQSRPNLGSMRRRVSSLRPVLRQPR